MANFCVCAEPIEERGLYPCGHALCLSCTLKKRTLMKDSQCPYCRTPAKQVAVVANGSTDISAARLDFQPGNLKVEDKSLVKKLRHILEYPCPECDEEQKNYKTLKAHVNKEHSKALCDVCTRHEYNFSDEYRLFDQPKIKEHLKKQHVSCKYCRSYFYGITEFSKHCRETHMGCGICERRDPEHPLYFKTYDQLYEHYKDKHYMCMVPACLENKHIVFGTALELKRHMIEAHKGLISNPRQAQQVDLDQLSQDAEEAQASTSRGPSINEVESERVRYEARLDIAANHDTEKIDKLHGANSTFMHKKVPVDIFIATYESVLQGTPATGITTLLSAFKKSHKSLLSAEANRALGFKINLRSQAEREDEDKKSNAKQTNAQQSDSSKQQASRGPSPAPIPKINWGYNIPSANAIGNLANLPKLGSKSNNNSNTNISASSSAWNPQKIKPPVSALQKLPTLSKKSNPFQPAKPNPLNVRQTSIPLRDSRSQHSQFFDSLRSGQHTPLSSTASPRDSSPNTPRTSSPSPSSSFSQQTRTTSASSSSSSSSSASPSSSSSALSSSRHQGLQLNNLPKLPKQQQVEKKRQHNVVRIV